MLFMPLGTSKLTRIHGAFISEEEIHEIVEHIEMDPIYLDDSVLEEPVEIESSAESQSDDDPMYEEAVRVVVVMGAPVQATFSVDCRLATTSLITDQMERTDWGAEPRCETGEVARTSSLILSIDGMQPDTNKKARQIIGLWRSRRDGTAAPA